MQQGRPLAYFSKSLGPKADMQSVYEKEAIAILEAIKKWRHYLVGNKLIIKTDHESLKHTVTQRLTEGIQHKLLLKLLEFDYTIEYKRGKENLVADALSRKDVPDSEQCMEITTVTPEWLQDVKASYEQDSDNSKILQKLAADVSDSPKFTLTDGIIKFSNRIYVGASTDLRTKLLHDFHDSALGGHSGTRATYHRLKRLFYWPGMKSKIEQYIAVCPTCQLTKPELLKKLSTSEASSLS